MSEREIKGAINRRKMSAEALDRMHRLNENEMWRARCWNCHEWNTAPRHSLLSCKSCGVNLWRRNG